MVFLDWIVLLNPPGFASRPWGLSAHVKRGMWLSEGSLVLVTADVRAGRSISWLQQLGERALGLEARFLS